jgi:hypothetical protein
VAIVQYDWLTHGLLTDNIQVLPILNTVSVVLTALQATHREAAAATSVRRSQSVSNETHPRPRLNSTRKRMLTFRVTEEEFEQLQAASNAAGARCLSDFLRESVLEEISQDGEKRPKPASVARQLVNVEERVNHLETKLSDLWAERHKE